MAAFAGWQAFFGVTGAAAATLTGLLFVVVSFMQGRDASKTARGVMLFMSPIVFHLVSVLAISALALAPGGEGTAILAVMTIWAAFGLAYATPLAVRLALTPDASHWSDFWWYGFAPALVFLELTAGAASVWRHWPHAAAAVALGLLALLAVAIRNAWDLVTWLAPRREGL